MAKHLSGIRKNIKSKISIATLALVVSQVLTSNGYTADFENFFVSTNSINNLVLLVSIIDTKDGTNTTELPIQLLFKAPTNTSSQLYLPEKEYLAHLELYDSSNHTVTKTDLGSKYGQNFDELYWDINKFANKPNGWHPKIITVRDRWDSWSWAGNLPKASDLFVISKPGTYRLKLEVQVMLLYLDTRKKQVRQIVRFQPIEIKVEKPNGQ